MIISEHFFERYGHRPSELKASLLNNVLLYEEKKISLSFSNGRYNTNFKHFDDLKQITEYMHEIYSTEEKRFEFH
jgi:hypothetical protein